MPFGNLLQGAVNEGSSLTSGHALPGILAAVYRAQVGVPTRFESA